MCVIPGFGVWHTSVCNVREGQAGCHVILSIIKAGGDLARERRECWTDEFVMHCG